MQKVKLTHKGNHKIDRPDGIINRNIMYKSEDDSLYANGYENGEMNEFRMKIKNIKIDKYYRQGE